ncbi:MAG: hypothetical protein RLY86_2868 [Pseudomonadota bacterium]|jgi:pimeloyl-ACP methyl ester carboxylesterase
MTEIQSRTATANGITLHWLEAGSGPLVLLVHGWPELSWSWRHQIPVLAAAGYRVVAPDLRGFGGSDVPADPAAYTLFHHVGDMVGLLDALAEATAIVVGHDWGAPVAWHCALFRPDRFRAVAGLSVPYSPRSPAGSLIALARARGLHDFYMVRFQEPGQAEAELDGDVREMLKRLFVAASGEGTRAGRSWPALLPKEGFAAALSPVETLPPWLTEADLDRYAENYSRTGFTGSLNLYRNMDRNWEMGAPWTGAPITVPATFIVGELDGVIRIPGLDKAFAALPRTCLDFRGTTLVPGAGHWVQQEAADTVNAALLAFLQSVAPGA